MQRSSQRKITAICQGGDDQPTCVTKVLVAIIKLCIHCTDEHIIFPVVPEIQAFTNSLATQLLGYKTMRGAFIVRRTQELKISSIVPLNVCKKTVTYKSSWGNKRIAQLSSRYRPHWFDFERSQSYFNVLSSVWCEANGTGVPSFSGMSPSQVLVHVEVKVDVFEVC